MKKTILFVIALATAATVNAQTSESTLPSKTRLSAQSAERGTAAADQYNYQDKKILQALLKPEFPADFPKFDKTTMTGEQYNKTCAQWLIDHEELVKPEALPRLKRIAAGK